MATLPTVVIAILIFAISYLAQGTTLFIPFKSERPYIHICRDEDKLVKDNACLMSRAIELKSSNFGNNSFESSKVIFQLRKEHAQE